MWWDESRSDERDEMRWHERGWDKIGHEKRGKKREKSEKGFREEKEV